MYREIKRQIMKISNLLYLLAIVSLTTFSCTQEEEPPVISNPSTPTNPTSDLPDAPSFSLESTSGDVITSTQYKDKNLVIFFFGYDCPPCKAAGPDIESKLYQEFKSNSEFAMIGADQWEGNDAGVDNFQEITGITFPLGRKGADMAKSFNTTYDRLVVVNKDNKIVYTGNSIASNNLDEVIGIVRDLLN